MVWLKALLDLLRAHFIPAWIVIFTAGYMTAVRVYGGFSVGTLVLVVLIAAFGFEAGMVLNDWVDRDLDKKDVDSSLTRYFRPFKTRPLAVGRLKPEAALGLFLVLATVTVWLICRLPSPNRYLVLAIMIYAYGAEYFYQIKKRRQKFPLAQLAGRTDFALFPVAGYLTVGRPDTIALLYFLYFYPLAEFHLAVNDLADWVNDKARGLASVPQLWGLKGALGWVAGFLALHLMTASVFVSRANPAAWPGFTASYLLLAVAGGAILVKKTPKIALKGLPLIHAAMAVQALALIFLG